MIQTQSTPGGHTPDPHSPSSTTCLSPRACSTFSSAPRPKSALLARLWGTLQQSCRPRYLVLLLLNPWSYKNIRLIKCVSQACNCCLFLSFLNNIPLLEYLLGHWWLYWKFCLISLEAIYHGLYWSAKLIGRKTAKRRGTTSGGIKPMELCDLCQYSMGSKRP